jgi:hypothetical protein
MRTLDRSALPSAPARQPAGAATPTPAPTVPRALAAPILAVARRTNPLVLRLAGRRGVPIAAIEHLGRRSGRRYRTPMVPAAVADGFLISLPYGSGVAWCRNVLAGGPATLRWQGVAHRVVGAEVVGLAAALPMLPPALRRVAVLARFRQFLRLRTAPAGGTPVGADAAVGGDERGGPVDCCGG